MIKNLVVLVLVLASFITALLGSFYTAMVLEAIAFGVLFIRPIIQELREKGGDHNYLDILDRVLDKDNDLFR